MTFEEALDALLREYNKDDWEVTIRTLFKAIAAVEAHVWGPHPEPVNIHVVPRVSEPQPDFDAMQRIIEHKVF